MAVKLAIEDVVGVKVEGKNIDKAGVEKPFKFILVCERYTSEQMKAIAQGNAEDNAFALFEKIARDWSGQKLVLEDDGTPAAFSLEALRLMLTIPGLAFLCWVAYREQVGATAKN